MRNERIDPKTLVVPLRSNAAGLVAGAPVAAVRRRLKMASLIYDQILLEGGTAHVQAGPRGSIGVIPPLPIPRGGRPQRSGRRPQGKTSFS